MLNVGLVCAEVHVMRPVSARLRAEERGIALVLALLVLIVLTVASTAGIMYTISNSRTADFAQAHLSAGQIAEAGLNTAYSVLNESANTASDPALLGCSAGNGGSSNCTTPAMQCFAVSSPCVLNGNGNNCQQQGNNGGNNAGCSVIGTDGTADYYGYYNATAGVVSYSDANVAATNVPAGAWLLISNGYARNPTSTQIVKATSLATSAVLTTPNGPANVAVWNHLYSTAPPGSGCELDVTGTQVIIDVPVYVTGDMCLSGTQASVQQVAGGQAVDLHVEGKLVMGGTQSKVGTDALHPITSGYIGGGCTTSINSAGHTCTASDRYYVGQTSSLQALAAPVADGTGYYNSSDPGPKHACQTGTVPAPLASSTFDTNTTYGDSNATFDLTPSFSYKCDSTSGAATGEIWWDNSAKTLTVSGVVFFDGNITASQSLTYQHPAGIHAATIYTKTFTLSGTHTTLCAVASCDFSAWNPNQTMLMIVTLGSGTSVSLGGTQSKFQGALFANPTSTIDLSGTQVNVEGPIVGGKFTWGTQANLHPLPALTSLPPGAPLAYNAHATPQPPIFVKG